MTKARGNPHIASIGLAPAPYVADQKTAEEFFLTNYSGILNSRSISLIHALFAHPSIKQRRYAIDDPACLVQEDPDARIRRFTHWAIELSAQAITDALHRAGLTVHDVTGLVVNTCTGYLCPGISTYLLERMGFDRAIRLYDLVGGGCGGAIPNLQMAGSLLCGNNGGAVVSVSVEICSATLQVDNDVSLLLSNALFGDGAAAAVVWDRQEGLELVGSAGQYVPEHRDSIRYVHKKGQLHNQLSLQLPKLVGSAIEHVVSGLLLSHALSVRDIRHWALHTGGEKIINAVRDVVGIPEERLSATRHILAEYGNMSSPTVWFVLDDLEKQGIAPGEWCVMLAFGAGLSAHACLFRKR